MIHMEYYLIVSTVMMFVGIYGFVTRRNLLAMLISVELILNSVDINFVVCVTAPIPVRIRRIMQRDHIPAEKAQQWIDAVMPQEELAARSDFEIVNDGEQDIDAQVRKLLDIINNKE